jgi:hypothetical protein
LLFDDGLVDADNPSFRTFTPLAKQIMLGEKVHLALRQWLIEGFYFEIMLINQNSLYFSIIHFWQVLDIALLTIASDRVKLLLFLFRL